MSVPLAVMVMLSFVAATAVVLAAAMLLWDLRRPDEDLNRRLGPPSEGGKKVTGTLCPEGPEAGTDAERWSSHKRCLSPFSPPTRRIDRTFYGLIEGSGTRLDAQTALVLVAGLAVVGCAVPLVLLENLLAGAAGLLLGCMLPICWWTFRRGRRLQAMKKHLPETLELLSDAIRAGQTLDQAAELVAVEAPAPLREEFGYCAAQLKLGHSPVAVLERMARRVPLPEFKIFTTAVLVHRRTGGNLSLLAQRLAGSARDRHELHGHVKAVTAASRFSVIGLTLGTLAAVAALAWLRPEYLEAFRSHRLGPSLLITAAVLQIVGIVCVWRTLKVHF